MALWDIQGTAIYVNKFRSHYIREIPRKTTLADFFFTKNVIRQTNKQKQQRFIAEIKRSK